jgi:hypothetical protein
VHDPPCLEVGDRLLDDIADLVYLRIEFLLPVKEITIGGLLDESDHVIADVALIASPAARIECQENAGFIQAV